jgi:hypothetical protein
MNSTWGNVRLTAAESFWYVLGCIAFGGAYFAKVPAKKALSEAGLAEMTSAEQFWYVLQCIAFGAGYFAKLPVKKALSEMTQYPAPGYDDLGSGHDVPAYLDQPYQPEIRHNGRAGPSHAVQPGRRHARRDARDQQDWQSP